MILFLVCVICNGSKSEKHGRVVAFPYLLFVSIVRLFQEIISAVYCQSVRPTVCHSSLLSGGKTSTDIRHGVHNIFSPLMEDCQFHTAYI